MSLINEALKKAQPERPTAGSHIPKASGPAGIYQHPPRKKRSYLWGFLMAIVIVGLFSAGVSTLLVWQILGDDENKTAQESSANPETIAGSINSGQEPEWEKLPDNAQGTETTGLKQDLSESVLPVSAAVSSSDETSAEVQAVSQAMRNESQPVVEASTLPPTRPDAAVWARLQELEIRGIMSGGNKVLIHDLSTGKTKSYKPGDILDGSLALKIATIDLNAILFEDYGGSIHTKPF